MAKVIEKRCEECGGPMPPRRKTENATTFTLKLVCGRPCQIKKVGRKMSGQLNPKKRGCRR